MSLATVSRVFALTFLAAGCALPSVRVREPSSAGAAGPPATAAMRPRVDVGGGHRVLREEALWAGADGHRAVLAQVVWPVGPRAPLALEGGVSYASDDAAGPPAFDLDVTEVFVGARFAIPPTEGVTAPRLEPYVAGGLAVLRAELDAGSDSDLDTAVGAYVRVGLAWHLTPRFTVSFDYRVHHQTDVDLVTGPVSVTASSLDAGQFSLLAGLSF